MGYFRFIIPGSKFNKIGGLKKILNICFIALSVNILWLTEDFEMLITPDPCLQF